MNARTRGQVEEAERLFIEAYISNGRNGAKAAIAAGYKASAAKRQAVRILERPSVQEALRKRQEELAKRYELTTESVIAELAKIVRADLREMFNEDGSLKPPSEWPDHLAGAIASVEVFEEFAGRGADRVQIGFTKRIKVFDKNSALEKAMKHLGMFDKDNKQKTDPLREFLAALPGAVVGVVHEPEGDED